MRSSTECDDVWLTVWIIDTKSKTLNHRKTASQDSEWTRYPIASTDTDSYGRRRYNTTLRAIIPLPDPNAHPDSAAHLSAYPEFAAGATVMALYPDTSCFYRAEVISSPKDLNVTGRVSSL